MEDAFAQEIGEPLPGRALDDEGEQYVSAVAIAIARSRRKICGPLRLEQMEHIAVFELLCRPVRNQIFVVVET